MLDNSIKTIPKGWKKYILKNDVQFLKGIGLSKNIVVDNGRNKCVLYGELYTKYNESIKNVVSSTNSSEGTKSKAGDVLMPGSTTTKGIDLANAVAINENNVLLGGDIIIIRDKNKIFNNYYFAHYLTHIRRKDIEKLTQGTTIVHLYPRSLEKLEVVLPPIKEQNKIAEILYKVDEDIEKTEDIIKKTEKIKKGIVQNIFTESSASKKVKIREVAEVTSSKRVMVSDYVDEGIPFYRSTEIIKKSKNIPITNPLYISVEKFNFFKKRFGSPEKGDLLITAVGTIGDVYMVQDEIFYFKDGNSAWIRRIKDSILSEYLKVILGSSFYRDKLNNIAGGSSQKALTIQKLGNLEIPMPSIKEQNKIAGILSLIDKKIEINKQIKNKLIQLKKGLMSDLLNGVVRVN